MIYRGNKMRKKAKIFGVIIIIFLALFCIFAIVTCPNMNDSIIIRIKNIEIDNMSDVDQKSCLIFGEDFISQDEKLEINNDIENYTHIYISYEVENKSDKIALEDINFYPDFFGEIKDMVKVFNPDKYDYYTFAYPLNSAGLGQHILLKSNGKSREDIKNMLLEQSIKMVYFTGGLKSNTGHGYSGIGKHTYTFKIKDVIDY